MRRGSTVAAHERLVACRKKSCPLTALLQYSYHYHYGGKIQIYSEPAAQATAGEEYDTVEEAVKAVKAEEGQS
jgi:hypothetical protein